jgi:hypothetical protein
MKVSMKKWLSTISAMAIIHGENTRGFTKRAFEKLLKKPASASDPFKDK